jgi:hypothetical protein
MSIKVVSYVVCGYLFLFSGARVQGTCRFSLIYCVVPNPGPLLFGTLYDLAYGDDGSIHRPLVRGFSCAIYNDVEDCADDMC